MRLLSWDTAFLLLLIGQAVRGTNITSCDNAIRIHCNSDTHQIIVTDVNTTSTLATDLLGQCNSHQQCNVTNTHRECVHVSYWCKMAVTTVDIPKSSELRLLNKKLSMFSLMSHNYRQGYYNNVQSINCRMKLADKQNSTMRLMKVTVNELGSLASSDDVCLEINGGQECSSSLTLYKTYGPYQSNAGWQMKIESASDKRIRFWIDIYVSPNDDDPNFHLECHPYSVTGTGYLIIGSPAITIAVIIVVVILGALALQAVLMAIARSAVICRKRKSRQEVRNTNSRTLSIYADSDDNLYLKGTAGILRYKHTFKCMPPNKEDLEGARIQNKGLPPPPRSHEMNWSENDIHGHANGNAGAFDEYLSPSLSSNHLDYQVSPENIYEDTESLDTWSRINLEQEAYENVDKDRTEMEYLGLSQEMLDQAGHSPRS